MERKSNKSKSWVVTVVTQLCLCFALYLAFNLGNGKNVNVVRVITNKTSNNNVVDFYFISVDNRALLLDTTTTTNNNNNNNRSQLMDRLIKDYDVKFVFNLGSGSGEAHHHNAENTHQDVRVSWYSTKTVLPVTIVKLLQLPAGRTLDVFFVNTTILEDSSNVFERDQLQKLLASTLESTHSHWRIVIGLHPVDVCEMKMEQQSIKKTYEHMHTILVKYGVNVYLSRRGCRDYVLRDGIAYVGLPNPSQEGPDVMLENRQIAINGSTKEVVDVFLLHRINSLEMETYFVTLSGKVSHKIALPKQGRQSL